MANCCTNGLNQVFCNAFNKYYNTLYTNGEISKEETNNLLIIDYIRQCLSDDRYNNYYSILLKALRCIANNSCLLDTSWLYDRSIVPKVTNLFVTVLTKLAFTETDPIFSASPAATITEEDIDNWNNPSTSGGLFTINVTYHEGALELYTIDETWEEITDAYYNNQTLILRYNNVIYLLQSVYSSAILFVNIDSETLGLSGFEISTDGNNVYCTLINDLELQRHLVSGTSIKTINNSSILGSGNIDLLTPNFCPIIEDTRSSAVAAITGVAPFSELVDGQRITLLTKYNLTNYPTLNLTLAGGATTGAKSLFASYASNGPSQMMNTIAANEYIDLIYEGANNRWVMVGNRDTNNIYSGTTQQQINDGTLNVDRLITPKLFHDNAYIVELSYSSGSLKANKFYDFGTVSSLTIPSLDATNDLVSNALNFYALRFIAGADNLNITFPTGVIVDDEPTINTGDYVEIMINKYGSNFYASIKVWQAQ